MVIALTKRGELLNRKNVFIVACVLLLVASVVGNLWLYRLVENANLQIRELTLEYEALTVEHENLKGKYSALLNEHNVLVLQYEDLNGSYVELNTTYNILALNHSMLQEQYRSLNGSYTTLRVNYSNLRRQYNELNSKYSELFTNHNALLKIFNEPLAYISIPTTTELQVWLSEDRTDEVNYNDPNFVCGDFAVMLSQHAKLNNWDIGIVGIRGYTETYEPYSHALNAMTTVEGLVYIEPQNDHVWWYEDHIAIYENAWFEIDETWVYVQDVVIVILYQ